VLCPTVKFVTTETGGQLDSQGLHRVRERLVGQRTGRASLLESRPRSPARATLLAARTARHSFQAVVVTHRGPGGWHDRAR
jgi:hypothetical protein